jgi:hypothetical protein
MHARINAYTVCNCVVQHIKMLSTCAHTHTIKPAWCVGYVCTSHTVKRTPSMIPVSLSVLIQPANRAALLVYISCNHAQIWHACMRTQKYKRTHKQVHADARKPNMCASQVRTQHTHNNLHWYIMHTTTHDNGMHKQSHTHAHTHKTCALVHTQTHTHTHTHTLTCDSISGGCTSTNKHMHARKN